MSDYEFEMGDSVVYDDTQKLGWRERGKLAKKRTMEETGETSQEYNRRWLSIYVVYLCVFLSGIGFSLVLPSIWPYLQVVDRESNTTFLGLVVASFGVAQMFASIFFGYLADRTKKIKGGLIYSVLFTIAGSVIYVLAEYVPNNGRYVVLAGRFFVGLGAGDIALGRTYVSTATTVGERTDAVAKLSSCVATGYMIGPLLSTVFTEIGYPGSPPFSMYSVPVMVAAVVGVANLFVILFMFFDCPINEILARNEKLGRIKKAVTTEGGKVSDKKNIEKSGLDSNGNVENGIQQNVDLDDIEDGHLDMTAVVVINILFCFTSFVFAALDTIGTALLMDNYGYIQEDAILYQGLIAASDAVLFVLTILLLKPLRKLLSERGTWLCGYVFSVFGIFIICPWGYETLADVAARENQDLYDQYLGGVNPWPGVCGNGDENLLFSTIPSDNSNLTYGYCWELYDWCCRIPQITLPQYIIGQVTSLGLAYGLAFIMASSIYSKVLGPSNQGKMMGYLTASGSFARIVGPIYIGAVYESLGQRFALLSVFVLLTIGSLMILIFYQKFVPFGSDEIRKRSSESTDANHNGVKGKKKNEKSGRHNDGGDFSDSDDDYEYYSKADSTRL